MIGAEYTEKQMLDMYLQGWDDATESLLNKTRINNSKQFLDNIKKQRQIEFEKFRVIVNKNAADHYWKYVLKTDEERNNKRLEYPGKTDFEIWSIETEKAGL